MTPEESEVHELSGEESGNWFWNPLLLANAIHNPLKNGVPELIPDSFPDSSRTSLSSVWFAGATPDFLQAHKPKLVVSRATLLMERSASHVQNRDRKKGVITNGVFHWRIL